MKNRFWALLAGRQIRIRATGDYYTRRLPEPRSQWGLREQKRALGRTGIGGTRRCLKIHSHKGDSVNNSDARAAKLHRELRDIYERVHLRAIIRCRVQ